MKVELKRATKNTCHKKLRKSLECFSTRICRIFSKIQYQEHNQLILSFMGEFRFYGGVAIVQLLNREEIPCVSRIFCQIFLPYYYFPLKFRKFFNQKPFFKKPGLEQAHKPDFRRIYTDFIKFCRIVLPFLSFLSDLLSIF